MIWQQMWFLTNMVFVAMLIVFLFVHHSVTQARFQQDADRLKRSLRLRAIIGSITVLAFITMALFFLVNMRVNR